MIVSWIRHRSNASTSGDVLELQRRMGLEGIGLYWLAFEFFLSDGGRVRMTERIAETLASSLAQVEDAPAAIHRHHDGIGEQQSGR